MLDWFLYTTERQALFSLVEHYIPKFSKLNKKEKYELLTTGLKNEDPDFNNLNFIIMINVQKYIIQTKRFLKEKD